ncbi:hypothetical protein AMELA_G00107630 [Ameiurus melas]|uniref:5'-nucleotidase n=1 Tax=Ameiurus melas TaxID=219545 RepID=A0A7J6AR30_AMEME|nr:hypothetical protein AMELA_G00107630 [Ameiurus melas]
MGLIEFNVVLLQIPELKHASVRMRDGGRVETIIEHMRREGPNALQIWSQRDTLPYLLREGYKSFFDALRWNSVPLLIFSAGVGDIVEEVITEHGVFHPNVRVFSNYMDFDQHGDVIHTFNKREGALQNTQQFVHDRSNMLLLGDSLGDQWETSIPASGQSGLSWGSDHL